MRSEDEMAGKIEGVGRSEESCRHVGHHGSKEERIGSKVDDQRNEMV